MLAYRIISAWRYLSIIGLIVSFFFYFSDNFIWLIILIPSILYIPVAVIYIIINTGRS
jgi:hypothetical protein